MVSRLPILWVYSLPVTKIKAKTTKVAVVGRADLLALRHSIVARWAALALFWLTSGAAPLAGCAEENTGVDILFADLSVHLDTADKRAITEIRRTAE